MLLLNLQWESETNTKMERFENFAQKSNVCKLGPSECSDERD